MPDAPAPLDIRCFGPPLVRLNGAEAPPEVLWRKHVALLTYLALSHNATRSRHHLMGLLWPEVAEEKARRSLNEAIRVLRTALGTDRLPNVPEGVRLNTDQLEVDALAFERLRAAGDMRALDLVRGEFLEGFHVDDAVRFDAWMEEQRTRFRNDATRLILVRAEEQLAVNRFVEATALAQRALSLNPYSESAVALAMRSAALEGDTAGALARYREFIDRLDRDLDETSPKPLAALAERIRQGDWRRPSGNRGDPDPPLVGRRDQHIRLFTGLDEMVRTGPVCMVIEGDTGSGRTRLLHECAGRLKLGGAIVASAAILESDHDSPWSTLRALIRGGLVNAPGIAATDPIALRVLAGIAPELTNRVEPLEASDAGQVADAVGSLLRSVVEEQPVALLIDDAQWADVSTLAALRTVWTAERHAGFAFVLSVNTSSEMPAAVHALLASVGREIPGTRIPLTPLTSDDVTALTESLAPWCRDTEERDRLARRVEHESGGNSFLAVTLLRELGQNAGRRENLPGWPHAGATFDTSLPITIPAVLRSAIAARVARLDEDSMAVLRTASIGPDVIDPVLISEVMGLDAERVEAAVDRLEHERFFVFAGNRHVFNGRLLSATIREECILPGGRQRLRERYIAALAGRTELDARLLRVRLQAAAQHPDAFESAMEVVQRAIDAGARRTAQTAMHIAKRMDAADPERVARMAALEQSLEAQLPPDR